MEKLFYCISIRAELSTFQSARSDSIVRKIVPRARYLTITHEKREIPHAAITRERNKECQPYEEQGNATPSVWGQNDRDISCSIVIGHEKTLRNREEMSRGGIPKICSNFLSLLIAHQGPPAGRTGSLQRALHSCHKQSMPG